jgi:hypothetical protein
MKRIPFLLMFLSLALHLSAQSNPAPFVDELMPSNATPGGPALTLTVIGGNFISSSQVLWNGSALATQFVSAARLTATVQASNIAKASTAWVSVLNAGAPASNVAFFSVTNPGPLPVFTGATSLTEGDPQSVVTADFNGDGRLDVAVENGNTIAVLLGNGDGTFQPYATYPANFNPVILATGDFNGDGAIDLVVTNFDSSGVSVLLNNGDGTFQAPVFYTTGATPDGVVVGDFNRDGKLDLVVSAYGSISILLGNGDGTFQPQQTVSTRGTFAICTGDFNGDGILDLATLESPDVSIFLGNGDGTFQSPQLYPVGSGMLFTLAAGDVNGDGILDLAVTYDNGAAILLGNGNGSFGPATIIDATTGEDYDVAIQDVNGDGKPDLIIVDFYNQFALLLGNGDGTFQAPGYFQGGEDALMTSFGDFNNDGAMDLALAAFGYPGRDGGAFVALQTNGPAIELSQLSLQFSIQVYNTRSKSQSVKLSNVGEQTLMISQISIQGSDPDDYSQTNNCGSSVAVGDSCTIQVTFKPVSKGERRATLVINDNAIGAKVSVPLSGLGTYVTLSPSQLNFGDQKVGTTSQPQTVAVNNVGPQAVDVSSIDISGYFFDHPDEFHQTNNCSVISPDSKCSVTVTFAPTIKGAANGQLWVHHNGGGAGQDVVLNGTGTN